MRRRLGGEKKRHREILSTYVIDVGNNRHVTNVFDFVHLTTHVVDGKLLRRRGRVGQFRRRFRRPHTFFRAQFVRHRGEKKFTRTTRQRSQTRTSRASPRARIESYLNHGGRLFLIPFELLNARARVRAFFELERIFPFSMEMMMSLPFREVDNFRFFCLFRSKICNHKKSDDQQQERTCTLRTHV